MRDIYQDCGLSAQVYPISCLKLYEVKQFPPYTTDN